MRQIFRQELLQVGDDLVEMAELVATAMNNASTALRSADLALAEQVIDGDDKIDELERHLTGQCVTMLALQAPVAADLRLVVSALRLSATIERMGDLAQHVAFVARGRYPEHALESPMRESIEEMLTAATNVAERVVELLKSHEIELAQRILEDDNILDDLHRSSFSTVLDDSVPATRQQTVDFVLLARFLERFGDHGVSVANRITYLVTGQINEAASAEEDSDVKPMV